MKGSEGFKEYLDASALLERSKITNYEEWCSTFPTLSEGFWFFLNDASTTAMPNPAAASGEPA
jgi:hypothetical protein